MTCREVTSFLLEYIAGELPDQIAGPFEAHLAECQACRTYLDQYRKAIATGRLALAGSPEAEPPAELVQAVMAALADARRE